MHNYTILHSAVTNNVLPLFMWCCQTFFFFLFCFCCLHFIPTWLLLLFKKEKISTSIIAGYWTSRSYLNGDYGLTFFILSGHNKFKENNRYFEVNTSSSFMLVKLITVVHILQVNCHNDVGEEKFYNGFQRLFTVDSETSNLFPLVRLF